RELEELVHRAKHDRVRIERPASKADVGWPVVAKPLHQVLAAAEDPDWKSSAKSLSVSHKVGRHAEIFLRPAAGEAKAREYLVEDQDDTPLRAHRPQPLEPIAVGLSVKAG